MAVRPFVQSRRVVAGIIGAATLTAAPVAHAVNRISVDDFLVSYRTDVVEPTECYQVINYLTGWRGVGEIVKTTPQQAIDKLVPDLVVSSNVEFGVTTEIAYRQRLEDTKIKMAKIWVDKGRECGAVVSTVGAGAGDPSIAHRAPGQLTVKPSSRNLGLSGMFFSS